jgi:hypothetical protein
MDRREMAALALRVLREQGDESDLELIQKLEQLVNVVTIDQLDVVAMKLAIIQCNANFSPTTYAALHILVQLSNGRTRLQRSTRQNNAIVGRMHHIRNLMTMRSHYEENDKRQCITLPPGITEKCVSSPNCSESTPDGRPQGTHSTKCNSAKRKSRAGSVFLYGLWWASRLVQPLL